MKRSAWILSLLIITTGGFAQTFPSEIWHDGKVVLFDEDTLTGKIKYDLENDLIQLHIKNTIQTYSSRKILYFEIFDEVSNNYRYFYALPYEIQNNYEVPLIFEVLYEGPLSLLAREKIVTENVPQFNTFYRPQIFNTRARLDYTYYFLDKNGSIQRYTMKKGDLLRIMKSKSGQIRQYMRKNKLQHDQRNDLFRIVAYYNALINP